MANNDEMAIGAIQAMKAGDISMEEVIVTGVDATQDALVAMQSGDLDVTVFQNAAGQGSGRLAAYRIDAQCGALQPLETYDVGERPMWVLIVSLTN